MKTAEPPPASSIDARVLLALIGGQLGMHAAMAGLRMALPLQVLREGGSAWTVGMLLAVFAGAPVLASMHSGRMADRHGYHKPVRRAVAASVVGMGFALASVWLHAGAMMVALFVAAALTGAATNLGMLTLQRTAGLAATDATTRMRVFSWLGVAPSFSNVVGPVLAGVMIDLAGFAAAYVLLLTLPLAALWTTRLVPPVAGGGARSRKSERAWDLLSLPGMKRLLAVNWCFSTGWDVHAFAVPLLGHARGFSASTIGLILGAFTLAVTAVRLVVPLIAHRLEDIKTMRGALMACALVFALYPLARHPWQMGVLATALGLSLGVAQPIILTRLHQLTPEGRHGESLAFRSMVINTSSTLMPLVFGALGTAAGAGALFWMVGAALAGGSFLPRGWRSAR